MSDNNIYSKRKKNNAALFFASSPVSHAETAQGLSHQTCKDLLREKVNSGRSSCQPTYRHYPQHADGHCLMA
jgi:hypothetical protein